jgi:putative SOS response-associated peptidase YedK
MPRTDWQAAERAWRAATSDACYAVTMCGKFTRKKSWEEVHAYYSFFAPGATPDVTPPSDEVVTATPMHMVGILRLAANGRVETVPMRWGFAGKNETDPSRPKHMHARAETIDEKPTFAHAFRCGRGLLMVSTFNEGEELANGKTKQWVITPKDGQPMAIAVLFEEWRNDATGETLNTFVMVTTPPNELVGRITDRMPAVLPCEAWDRWLGLTDASPQELKTLLQTFDDNGDWDMEPQRKRAGSPAQQELF